MDRKRSTASALLAAARFLAGCFLAGTVFSILFLVNIQVSGGSMLPGLADGDVCTGPKHGSVSYGDIVVVDDRDNGRILVKRVAGLPGDVLEIHPDGTLSRNGVPVDEPYIIAQESGTEAVFQVPEHSVFVLGDNRGSSADSRQASIGCVDESRIMGRVLFRLWPLDRVGVLR